MADSLPGCFVSRPTTVPGRARRTHPGTIRCASEPGGRLVNQRHPLRAARLGKCEGFFPSTSRRNFCCRAQADGGSPASTIERSSMANEEIVLFLFQLQLDQEMKRAMTYENYETAMEIRERRKQVDSAVETLEGAKGLGSGAKGSGQKDVIDTTTQGLQIRSEMQKAVEEERYDDAAKFRDQLIELEDQAREAEASIDMVSVDPYFRLGQRVKRKDLGYRGVICGWDVLCCESDEWKKRVGLESLQCGAEQIFYHVIVDERDWNPLGTPPVAYVAEECLTCPELEDGTTWIETYGKGDEFVHPYAVWLFLGSDAAGDFIPCSQLRDKYSVERWDVYAPGEDGYDDDDDDSDGKDGNGDKGPDGGQ
ncbi:hypothetical protein BSKO_06381 [Bryopsis sp. KO-2023]|nr:hypothetical protein BSKO_06381 [Bryopsis sp. KO-2023]